MKHRALIVLIAAGMILGGCQSTKSVGCKSCQGFSHNVYFTLKDASAAKVEELIDECYTYLKDHPGVVCFTAGQLAPDHNRDVNVRDFDVSLTIVFNSVEAQDLYQKAPEHLEFIDRNRDNWNQVRVFDSLINR